MQVNVKSSHSDGHERGGGGGVCLLQRKRPYLVSAEQVSMNGSLTGSVMETVNIQMLR